MSIYVYIYMHIYLLICLYIDMLCPLDVMGQLVSIYIYIHTYVSERNIDILMYVYVDKYMLCQVDGMGQLVSIYIHSCVCKWK